MNQLVEYMCVHFAKQGEIRDTMQYLESELDSRAKMGWKLHTIEYASLDDRRLIALIIYEKPIPA